MALSSRLSSCHINFVVHELKNISSEVRLIDSDTHVEIVLCERNSITLQMQSISALVGHLLSIKGIFQFGDSSDQAFAAIGRITQIKNHQVEIKMNQYDMETWGNIIKRIAQKQQQVDTLFKSIKGED